MKLFEDPYVVDADLAETIIKMILEQNPHVHRGDTMVGPVGIVDNDGVAITATTGVDIHSPDVKVLTAQAIKVPLPLPEKLSFDIPKSVKFIHLYQCTRMKKVPVVGEPMLTIDKETFEPKEVIATEELVAPFKNAIFRYAVS